MTTHTPGPWHSYNTGVHVDRGGVCRPIQFVIGTAKTDQVSEDEAIANARLMAAAPDLLEALRKILQRDPGNNGEDAVGSYFADIARAAIARATGEHHG